MKTLFSIIIISASLFIQSCGYADKHEKIIASVSTMLDVQPGSCPFLTKDNKGNIVLSWVRNLSDSSFVLCYAVSADKGKTFGKAIIVPGSNNVHPHGENLPKIIFKPSGEIIAIWGAANANEHNAYSGLVYYAQSFDEGKSWSAPKGLVADTAGYDQRYFDVALIPGGETAIIWLDNRKKTNKEGSALYFASTSGKNGFQNEKLIGEPCCECCRTDLFIDDKSNIHVLYRAILNDSIRDMVHSVSTDGGKSFSNAVKISNDNWVIRGCPHSGPSMSGDKNGIYFAWFTGGNPTGIYYTRSSETPNSFSLREEVSGRGKHPQIATLDNEDILIAWEEPVKKEFKFNSQVGLEIRFADGSKEKQFITPDSCVASYPVICPVDKNSAMIAYNQERNGKSHVFFQLVHFS